MFKIFFIVIILITLFRYLHSSFFYKSETVPHILGSSFSLLILFHWRKLIPDSKSIEIHKNANTKLFALLTMDILDEDRLLTGFTVTGWVCLQKKFYGETITTPRPIPNPRKCSQVQLKITLHFLEPGSVLNSPPQQSQKETVLCINHHCRQYEQNHKTRIKIPQLFLCLFSMKHKKEMPLKHCSRAEKAAE